LKIEDEAVSFTKIQTINPNKLLGRTSAGVGSVEEVSLSGTGSTVLLANSPVLVNPNLGTPSAATLTFATGLPLSSGVTGNLSVSNGGTGRTTLSGLLKGNGTAGIVSASNINDYSLVREVEDQAPTPNLLGQTSFTLTQTPNANSKVKMYINGTKALIGSISVAGTTVTYIKENNKNIVIQINDIVEFVYYY
jgi:hypothetical protein